MCNICHENYIQIERTVKYSYRVGEITSWLCYIARDMYVEGEGRLTAIVKLQFSHTRVLCSCMFKDVHDHVREENCDGPA
jgi:hypothetical protein